MPLIAGFGVLIHTKSRRTVIENKAKVEDQAKSLKDNEDLLMDTSSVTKYASGVARTFSGGLRRSTVAHFARKVRGTNIVAAKHGLSPPKKNHAVT